MMKLLLAVAAAVALRMMLAWSLTRHKPGRTRSAPIPLAKPTWPSVWAAGPAGPGGSRVLTGAGHPAVGSQVRPSASGPRADAGK